MKFFKRLIMPALLASCAPIALAQTAQAQPCSQQVVTATIVCTTAGNLSTVGIIMDITSTGNLTMTVRNGDTVRTPNADTIHSLGTLTLINNGTVGGGLTGGEALNLQGGTFTITNAGTIQHAAGVNMTFVYSGQASGTVTNSETGIISASGSLSTAIASVSRSAAATTIVNRGRITASGTFASTILVDGNATSSLVISNYGTIAASGTNSVAIGLSNATSKLTLNIYPGSQISGERTGLKMGNLSFTGSTINFYTGSYSLAVENFQRANHTVNLMSAGSVLNFTGADTANGNGTLVVTTPAPTTNMPAATQAVAGAVQSALQMATPRNIVPPLQNTMPDTSSAFAPVSTSGPANGPPMNLGMRGTYEDAPLPLNRQGFDRYGNLVWARAFGSAHFQPSTDAIAGTINRTTGALIGYDRQFTNWRLGVYGGYGLSNTVLADSSGKLQTEMYIGGLYGRTKLAGTTLTFNLAGGLLGNHSSRIINGGRDASAAADFSGAFVAPDVAIAYDIPLGYGFTLTPGLRARYIGTFTQDYAESGSNQNIAYQSAKSHVVEERAELRLSRTQRTTAGTLLTSYLDGAVIASQRLGAGAVTASVLGTEFSVQNGNSGTVTGLMLGTGLDLQIAKDVGVYTSGDVAEYTDGSRAASARLGVRMAF